MTTAYQDKNGVVYLVYEQNIQLGRGLRGIRAVVNRGRSVNVVSMSTVTMESLYLQPLPHEAVANCANRLLQPFGADVTIDPIAREVLGRILKEEVEMAKKATAEAPAAVPEKTNKKFAGVTAPAPAAKGESKAAKADAAGGNEGPSLYDTFVVSTGKGAESREGSLWRKAHDLSQKPVKLGDLIEQVAGEIELKSEKDKDQVVKIRLRDGYTRLGFLQDAPAGKK